MNELAIMPLEDYKNTCDNIRAKTETGESIKSGELPDKIDAVYEAGKKAEYDAFWDAYQQNGNRTNYSGAFGGEGWGKRDDKNAVAYKPKYNMTIQNASTMFANSNITDVYSAGNKEITLDFSKCTVANNIFYGARVEHLKCIDISKAASLATSFAYASNLKTIDRLILNANGSTSFVNTFINCAGLENLTIEGVIGKNGFDVQWSTKLTHESLMSIINALSTGTSGLSVTLSKTAVNEAFETNEGANDGSTSAEWLALANTRSNWTISLV